jgi:hypothetical protein
MLGAPDPLSTAPTTVPADEFHFGTSSSAFLKRAGALLAKFDETDDAALLLYAALELRNGIEARLWEYINFQAPGTVSRREHKAKVLLRALRENAFETQASSTTTIKWHFEGETVEKTWSYVPATDSLAAMHGRLGDYLHASLFYENPQIRYRVAGTKGQQTFLDIRGNLGAIAKDLATVIAGNRLGPFDLKEYLVTSKRMWRRFIRAERLKERAKAKGNLKG